MKKPHLITAATMLLTACLTAWWLRKDQPGSGRADLYGSATAAAPGLQPRSGAHSLSPAATPAPRSPAADARRSQQAAGGGAAAPSGNSDPAPAIRRRFAPAPAAARLPLVFAMPPEEMTGLNERQAAAAVAIAEQFYSSIGGESADPSTPEYKDRWKREQPLADYQLRAAIGAQAYARYQEAAYLRAKAAASQ